MNRFWLALVAALVLGISPSTGAEPLAAPILADAIQLPTTEGGTIVLPVVDAPRLTVLCFLGTECPLAKLYGPRLEALGARYAAANVTFVGINSNRQDSLDDIRRYAGECGLTFTLAKDYDHALADRFAVRRTPEVCVVDATGRVRYRGRVDDQYQPGLSRPAPTRRDLALALDDLLAGRPVGVESTEPVGCLIGRNPEVTTPTTLTYCRDITRVLQRNCVECHRAGDIGPFALTDYDEVVGWGDMLLEVIADGRMPPWHATEDSGPFANAREMTSADRDALRAWVAGGMPFGVVEDLPPTVEYETGWKLGREPDQVVAMRTEPFTVPAQGVVDYQYFVVDPGFTEDRWVTGAEVQPGNRAVVHHCIVFIRPPDGTKLPGMGWLTAYVPGQRSALMPNGMGRWVPAGSRLVFQMHYTPNGVEQSDLTQLGLLFGDEAEISQEVFTLMAINQDFEIPPGDPDFRTQAKLEKLPRDAILLAMAPHMHVRGKSCRVVAHTDSGSSQLLNVPRYDFNWQHVYELQQAIPLNSVKSIEFTAHFDNSPENPVNPDPTQYVHWGDQTWEEMTIAFFEVARPRKSGTPTAAAGKPSRESAEPATEGAIARFVDDFFARNDADQDGSVDRDEVPTAVKQFGFKKLDTDSDGRLSRAEIVEHARREGRFQF